MSYPYAYPLPFDARVKEIAIRMYINNTNENIDISNITDADVAPFIDEATQIALDELAEEGYEGR